MEGGESILPEEELNKLKRTVFNNLVLLLGRYDKSTKDFLDLLRNSLSKKGYQPIIAKHVERSSGETPRKKLHFLIAASKFVIADDSSPSGTILELGYCYNIGAPTALLRRNGRASSWMTLDFEVHSRDFKSFQYLNDHIENVDMLEELLDKIIDWARNRINEREREFMAVEQGRRGLRP